MCDSSDTTHSHTPTQDKNTAWFHGEENVFQLGKKLPHTCFDCITRRHAEIYHRPCGCARTCQFEFSADTTALITGPKNKQTSAFSEYLLCRLCWCGSSGMSIRPKNWSFQSKSHCNDLQTNFVQTHQWAEDLFNTQRQRDDGKPFPLAKLCF